MPKDIPAVLSSMKKEGIQKIVDMTPEQRVKFFTKLMKSDGAEMASEFERALASTQLNALKNFLRKNFDTKYRAKLVTRAKKSALLKYIDEKLYPSTGGKSISIDDMLSMPKEKMDKFIDANFSEKNAALIKANFEAAKKIAAKGKEVKARVAVIDKERKRLERQIENYLSDKKKAISKAGKSFKDIVAMGNDERLAFLKKNGVEDADKLNTQITKEKIARELEKSKVKELAAEKKLVDKQKDVIKRFIAERKPRAPRTTLDIDKILEMPEAERLAFLKKHLPNGESDAMDVMRKIQAATKTPFEQNIDNELARYTNFNETRRFIDKTVDTITNEKAKMPVTVEEVQNITKLSAEIHQLKLKAAESGLVADRIAAGRKMQDLGDYLGEIQKSTTAARVALTLSGMPRALLAGYELSSIGIQAFHHFTRLFYDSKMRQMLARSIGFIFNENAYKDYLADITTSDIAPLLAKAKVRNTMRSGKLTEKEEDFMTNLFDWMRLSKVPIIGSIGEVGKGFERFHSGYLTQIRFETAGKLIRQAKDMGMDMSDKNLEYLGAVVNDYTGGSTLGRYDTGELPSLLNQLTFSFRKVVSDIKKVSVRPVKDTYKLLQGDEFEKMVAQESMKRLASGFGLMAGITGLVLQGKAAGMDMDVELDPTSSKFGDIRIGEKTYNISGGSDWVITLFARMVANSGKNQYGIEQEYGTGYGQQNRLSAMLQTIRYKASPNAAIIVDFLAGANAMGENWFAGADRKTLMAAMSGDQGAYELLKTGAQREAFNRFVPIFWQSMGPEVISAGFDIQAQLEAIKVYGIGAIGIAANDQYYAPDWIDNDTKEMSQFKEKKGLQATMEAGEMFNEKVKEEIKKLKKDEKFTSADSQEKQKQIEAMKRKVKKEVFASFGFTYTKE